jgi:hypothetical protein
MSVAFADDDSFATDLPGLTTRWTPTTRQSSRPQTVPRLREHRVHDVDAALPQALQSLLDERLRVDVRVVDGGS